LKRSVRCRAFQVTALTCDNLLWLPRARRFYCGPLRAQ
jgi:hypothetical protein